MHRAAARSTSVPKRLAALALALSVIAGACGGGSSDDAEPSTTASDATSSTAAPDESTSSTSDEVDATTTTTAAAPSTTALPDASEAQRTAPGDGTGTALLTSVRVGRNEGFERIVFEFEGTSVPGYRIQWVDGPITADGSGEPVEVAGEAYLEMVMQPASGVDLSAADLRITYEGPDRIAMTDTELLTDLVRTGDFEAVLSWAAGATQRAPFRVLTLSSPTRVVVDLATPS